MSERPDFGKTEENPLSGAQDDQKDGKDAAQGGQKWGKQ